MFFFVCVCVSVQPRLGTDGTTYPSTCQVEVANCLALDDVIIIVVRTTGVSKNIG